MAPCSSHSALRLVCAFGIFVLSGSAPFSPVLGFRATPTTHGGVGCIRIDWGPWEAHADSVPFPRRRLVAEVVGEPGGEDVAAGDIQTVELFEDALDGEDEHRGEGPRSRVLVPLPAVSWPWDPPWGSLEPPRPGGENAQQNGNFRGRNGRDTA